MVGDKFKDGFPVDVTFVPGEQPDDNKLTGWAQQSKNAIAALERGLGDIWDQSKALGTDKLSNRNLQIANIGRMMGPASMISPQILHGVTISDYEFTVPVGVKEFVLPHIPTAGVGSITWSGTTFGVGQEKTAITDVAIAGDYYVDYTTGRVFTYTLTQSGDSATYEYDSIGDSFVNASLNVIPDPNQTTERCTVEDVAGELILTLPYIKYDQEGILQTDGSDPNQSSATSTHNQQRALLPSFLSVLSNGDLIPQGFVYVYDNDLEEIVSGTTLRYRGNLESMTVEGVTLVEGNARYSVITIGTPLSELVFYMRKRQREHVHGGSDGTTRIPHSNLLENMYRGEENWGAADAIFVDPGYKPSAISANDHSHYLMRSGYKSGIDPVNSDNAMRGDILMGSSSPSGNEYANLSGKSRSVFFGSEAGPRFRYNNIYDALQLANKDMMADLNISVGRGSAVGNNIGYLGFGTNPAGNNVFFNEAHAISARYQFKTGGTTPGADLEAGAFISRDGRLYFGDKTGTGDSYLAGTGNLFQLIGAGGAVVSELEVGLVRLMNNRIYLANSDDYLDFDDSTNKFRFIADGSEVGSWVQVGNLIIKDNEIRIPDSSNRLYKSGSNWYFDHSGSYANSTLRAGALVLNDTTLSRDTLRDLTDGGHTTSHTHYYYRYFGSMTNSPYRASGDFSTKTFGSYGAEIIGLAIRGWSVSGGFGNNNQYFTRSGNSIYWWVEGPGGEDWDDSGYVRLSVTYRSSSSYSTH